MHRISLIINYSLLIVNYPRPLISLTTWLLCVAVWAQTSTFPLPSVPDTLQQEERLAYVLRHYWDNYQWNDCSADNQLVGEQGLVDFLNLMQYADSLTADGCSASFVRQAFTSDEHRAHYGELLDHYLYNQHSPVRNDLVYAHLLRHLSSPSLMPDTAACQRYWYRLQQVEKNQVGTVAADLRVRGTDGRQHRLHEIRAPFTVLMFTDPDCGTCQMTEEKMKHEPLLDDSCFKIVRVLLGDVPSTYFVPFTPSFYLLDAEKRIVLKNATFEQMLQTLRDIERK